LINPTQLAPFSAQILKVWIVDPAAATLEELNSPVRTTPSPYSQIITRRFYLSGLVPCIRHAHAAIEVITDAEYAQDWEQGRVNDRVDGGRIAGYGNGAKLKEQNLLMRILRHA